MFEEGGMWRCVSDRVVSSGAISSQTRKNSVVKKRPDDLTPVTLLHVW